MRFRGWMLFPVLVGCNVAPALSRRGPAESRSYVDPCSVVQCTPHDTAGVRIVNSRLIAGETALTPQFTAIQSFDVSLERREVAFSARRTDNFDIGLVSLDGSDIHWVPADPADEIDVQWAPRGNKISYTVRGKVGDVVRTLHVPTSAQLSVAFPYATISALAWNRAAERYAVVISSPDASERIESMKYSGEERRVDVPPGERLDVAEEPVAGGVLLRPGAMHYGERLPLFVWVADPPFVWNAERAALMRKQRVACAIMRRAPDDAFWAAVRAIPWIDTSRVSLKDSNGVR